MSNLEDSVAKALDKFSGVAEETYQKIQQVAPEIWKMTVNRYIVLGFVDLIYMFIWCFAAFALWYWGSRKLFINSKCETFYETEQIVFGWVFSILAGLIAAIAISINLPQAIDYFFNAKFHAAMCIVGKGC